MPDEPAGQDVAAHAQALGADILAKLDELTQQPTPAESVPAGVTLEERKRLAQQAVDKMDAIVARFLAQVEVQQTAGQEAQAASAQGEIARIKASIGA